MTKAYIPAAFALALLLTGPASAEETKPAPVTAEVATNLAGEAIQGRVLEVQSAGGYSYLLLQNEQGTLWTAIPESKVEAGQEVLVGPGMLMKSFESKALGKNFDLIIFSSGLADAGDSHKTAAAEKKPHPSSCQKRPYSISFCRNSRDCKKTRSLHAFFKCLIFFRTFFTRSRSFCFWLWWANQRDSSSRWARKINRFLC